jgi:hypothetical protein
MKKTLIILLFLLFSSLKFSFAALPPKYQLQRDLHNISLLVNDNFSRFISLTKKDNFHSLKYVNSKGKVCFLKLKRKTPLRRSKNIIGPIPDLEVVSELCKKN